MRSCHPRAARLWSTSLQRNVDAIRKANGIPHINHPNFRWSITREEFEQVRNNRLFEIFNGHPQVNNQGGGGVPGLEEVVGRHPDQWHAPLWHCRG